MSADNWAICPKCKAERIAKRDKAKADADECYGKVDAFEYHRRLQLSSVPVNLEETMREDYKLGTDDDGKFCVIYGASCSTCGFQFKYHHEEKVLKP